MNLLIFPNWKDYNEPPYSKCFEPGNKKPIISDGVLFDDLAAFAFGGTGSPSAELKTSSPTGQGSKTKTPSFLTGFLFDDLAATYSPTG